MSEWKPKLRPDIKFEKLNLSGEEGFVLSRIDGSTSMQGLVHLTGLPEGRVQQIVQRLVQEGAVEGTTTSGSPATGALPRALPRAPAPASRHSSTPEEFVDEEDELSPEELAQLFGDNTMDGEPVVGADTEDGDAVAPPPEGDPDGDGSAERPDVVDGESSGEANDAADEEREDRPRRAEDDESLEESDGAEEKEEGLGEDEQLNYRKLFNETLSKLEAPAREAMAKTAKDPELSALCFDPLPAVILGVLENHAAGFQHARLVARHHHTPQGLDHVMHRAEFFRDAQTQRLLLQNTMLQEPQIKRLLQAKRLADVYKVTISREIPERNRQKARNVLRNKWSMAEAEERAGLIFSTEARCLAQLTGLPFDSRTTSMLCSKSYASTLMIQNLARFGATPPPVLVHLLRQQVVRRQQMLKNLILQHPNCPADAKRKG